MRMYAIYDKEYGYIGTTELDMVEVRALESDNSLIVIPVQGYRIMNTYRQRGVTTVPLLVGSDITVLNIWDMVGTKVSEQD